MIIISISIEIRLGKVPLKSVADSGETPPVEFHHYKIFFNFALHIIACVQVSKTE